MIARHPFIRPLLMGAVALTLGACAAPNLVTQTAEKAHYEDVEIVRSEIDAPYTVHCTMEDRVGHVMSGKFRGRLTTFAVCCGPDRDGCAVVPYN